MSRLPYPGLRAFTREESDLFFGREDSVDAMVECLDRNRFMAVLGPSGSGKSSLVRTGLLDALALGLLGKAGAHWKIADMHPGREPMLKLAQALLSIRSGPPADATDVDLMTSFLRQGPRSIEQWAKAGNLPSGSNLLILVDQFEELFRYADYEQREAAESFVAALLRAASVSDAPIYVLLTMRSEYLGACASIQGLAERISEGLYLTPRMDRDQCKEAIEGPAGVVGFKIEPELVNGMLNDLATFAPWQVSEHDDLAGQLARQADQLPLMQHVLNRLWLRAFDRPHEGKVLLTLEDYETIGGLSGALDAHGQEVMDSLQSKCEAGPQCEPIIASVFQALVGGNTVATAVRRPSSLKQLIAISGGKRQDVIAIVEAFRAQGCNFLRTSEEFLTDSTVVDISHESLIRQWTCLSGWLEQEVRDDGEWRRLLSDEERYSSGKGGLLTGLNFQTAAAWWLAAKPTPAWAERHGGNFEALQTYLEASRKEEEHQAELEVIRQRELRNRLWVSLAVLAVGLIAVSITAFFAHTRAEQASSAQAIAQTEKDKAEQSLYDLQQTQGELAGANKALSARQIVIDKNNSDLQTALTALKLERTALIGKTQEAEDNAAAAQANAEKAHESEESLLAALTGMGVQFFSDKSNYELAGTENIKASSIPLILKYEATLPKMGPDQMLRNYYQGSVALERAGEAKLAGDLLKRGYDSGLTALNSTPAPSEELLAYFLDDAYDYSSLLKQTGNTQDSEQVRQQMEQKVQLIPHPRTALLAVARARVEDLEALYHDSQSAGDSRDKVKQHTLKAVEFSREAKSLAGADTEAETFTIHALLNNHGVAKGLQTEGCKLAGDLYAKHPSDTRAVDQQIKCLDVEAQDAGNTVPPDSPEAREAVAASTDICRHFAVEAAFQKAIEDGKKLTKEDLDKHLSLEDVVKRDLPSEAVPTACYEQAESIARTALEKDPANTNLLLWMAKLEIGINRWAGRGVEHDINAKSYFVTAVNGKTISHFPSDLPDIYDSISVIFYDQKESARYYSDIANALARDQDAFPNDHMIGAIVSDANLHAGLALAQDPKQSSQAEASLSKALQGLARYRFQTAPAEYSEDYADYCMAYGTLARVQGANGKLDAMLAGIEKMKSLCAPVLEKYPWDFRVRIQSALASADVGQTLFDHSRFQDAVPYLQFASDWGLPSSSLLLSRIYRDGKLGAPDPRQAEMLQQRAVRQGTLYFTAGVDFHQHTRSDSMPLLVQEWPDDNRAGGRPRNIIEDQVEWWQLARGGAVRPGISQFLLTLRAYAIENQLPFSHLAASFGTLGAKPDAFSEPFVTKWFPQFGLRQASSSSASIPSLRDLRKKDPEFASEFDSGQEFETRDKYADALREYDLAIKREPDSVDVLEKEGYLLHDQAFSFERSFEQHRKAIELGGGDGLNFIEAMFSVGRYRDCATFASAARDVTSSDEVENMRVVGFRSDNPGRFRQIMGSLAFACLTALKDQKAAADAGMTLRRDLKGLQPVRWNFPGTERYMQSHDQINDALFDRKNLIWKDLFTALEQGKERMAHEALTRLGVPEPPDIEEPRKLPPTKILSKR